MTDPSAPTRVVVVGGGFAGVNCARALAKHSDRVEVTLLDRNDYHQFQPLLYQVATSMLAPGDIAYPLRKIAAEHDNLTRTAATWSRSTPSPAASRRPAARRSPGTTWSSRPDPSRASSGRRGPNTPSRSTRSTMRSACGPGSSRPSRRRTGTPDRADDGAITFVIVGGGPTGVEVAGALSEMITTTMVHEFPKLAPKAKVYLVNHGDALLAMFADKGHKYTADRLTKDGVELLMGLKVTEIGPGHVKLSDDRVIRTRSVIWGGGLMAAPVAGASGLPQGRGGRIDVQPDFTVAGFPGVLAIGDVANIPHKDGKTYPQLGSVALQSGGAAAKTILADIEGKTAKPFHYLDKGTMAMIGRGAAIAQVPPGSSSTGSSPSRPGSASMRRS